MSESIPDVPVGEEVADLLHAVNRRIRSSSHHDLGPLGVTPAQARALRTLGRAGQPMRMRELADRLHIARRSTTSVIDDLATRQLVDRRDDPTDRRGVLVEPTAAGRAVLRQLEDRRRAAATSLLAKLSGNDLARLRDLLRRLDAE